MHKGVCPKCHRHCRLTRHHVFPRRYFAGFPHLNDILWLCRKCHDQLENMIPEDMQDLPFYNQVIRDFLGTKPDPMTILLEELELADAEKWLVDSG